MWAFQIWGEHGHNGQFPNCSGKKVSCVFRLSVSVQLSLFRVSRFDFKFLNFCLMTTSFANEILQRAAFSEMNKVKVTLEMRFYNNWSCEKNRRYHVPRPASLHRLELLKFSKEHLWWRKEVRKDRHRTNQENRRRRGSQWKKPKLGKEKMMTHKPKRGSHRWHEVSLQVHRICTHLHSQDKWAELNRKETCV